MRAPPPADEPARLAALHDTHVLDTPPEADFDDIALLASEICGTPMGLVSLVDQDRQWFRGYLEILLESDFDADTSRRFLSVMERNSDRLLRLIEELLQVARLNEDVIRLDLAELDLADLTHQVMAL